MNRNAPSGGASRAVCNGATCRRDPGGRGRVRLAAPGTRLCLPCREELVTGLRRLPGLYKECERVLSASSPRSYERVASGSLPGMPFNGAAADIRTAILSVLSSWSGLVAGERGQPAPRRSVLPLVEFLVLNADWLAAHSAAREITAEIAGLVRTARRVARPQEHRRLRVGRCVQPGCNGELLIPVQKRDQRSSAPICCDADHSHVWTSDQWTRLSRLMRESKPAVVSGTHRENWLTASDISRLWGTPIGTVYRLASQQQWRRQSRSGRILYAEADVHDCFNRRATRTG